jgi:hypothetical protein
MISNMRSITYSVLLGLALLGQTIHAQTIVFQDNFDNGSVANSDTINNYWTTAGGAFTYNEDTTGTGILNVNYPTGQLSANVNNEMFGLQSTSLNFFNQSLTYSARFDLTGSGGGSNQRALRFGVYSNSNASGAYGLSNDAVIVYLDDSGQVRMGFRENASTADPNNLLILQSSGLAGTINGFDLTLNGTVGTGSYSLTLFSSSLPSVTYTGSNIGLTSANWDTDTLAGFRYTRQSVNGMNVAMESFAVTSAAVPEPSTFMMIGFGFLVLVARVRKGKVS